MPETRKVLGQALLLSGSLTTIYTVPALTQTIISTLNIANTGSVSTTFRVAVSVNGAADTASQYLYWDVSIPGNETYQATAGFTLGSGDILRGFGGNAALVATVFGVEIV
jgi:hypothetical protein